MKMKKLTNAQKAKKDLNMILCKHCHKQIISPELVGMSLVCPHCKKPVNGQYHP